MRGMKAELNIDTSLIAAEIAKEVMKNLQPIISIVHRDDDPLLTVQTLAKYLRVSPQWIYERVQLKEIPHAKIGKYPRFRKAEIDLWIDSLKIPAANKLSKCLKLVK